MKPDHELSISIKPQPSMNELLEFIQNAPTAWWVIRSGSDAAAQILHPLEPGTVLFSEYPAEDVHRNEMTASDWRAWLVEELKKRYL